eukprot:CAMPEP_0204616150 /NCGR_PEP_ID=MMETSP0717-20131115/3461_1 /ASSEMBLY_ACC=CAM_ASM_000666 /TAXON_ID=230516 /ORGANISM="Chaetoceros curvisetus" /LENGTH=193 /DNA_ID=CAMNT_0051629287 /DNA_START=35 /DNA_END=616 /DNA_ORIENTATION=-
MSDQNNFIRRRREDRNTNNKDERRTGNSVISLTQFAHSKAKGTRRAIENYKRKKQNKFNHNANLLKGYRKAMKKEGYEAGKGGSRKRRLDDIPSNGDGARDNEESIDNNTNKEWKIKKKRKTDPFAKARMKAEQNKQDELKKKQEHTEQLEQQKRKQQEKKMRTKKLAKRTRKGQPIMKNMIEDMLDKIKSQP